MNEAEYQRQKAAWRKASWMLCQKHGPDWRLTRTPAGISRGLVRDRLFRRLQAADAAK